MTGYKYVVPVDQLEVNGSLHLDSHMLFMEIQEEQPVIITAIMTQFLLKTGFK